MAKRTIDRSDTMSDRRKEKFLAVLRHRRTDLTVILENIHDPHNVSAILRSADAVGILEVQLVYTQEQFPKLGRKSSASAAKWVKRRSFRSIADCYATLRTEGFTIYATRLGERSTQLFDLDITKKVALVFGNEHRGVSAEAMRLADGNFNIPMVGMIQSLNVSVACAVALYEAFRQRRAIGNPSMLSDVEQRALFREWAKR